MIYIFVIIGSATVISAIIGMHFFLQERSVRRFVRNVNRRSEGARYKSLATEELMQKPKKSARITALELKKVRELMLKAERAIASGKTQEAEHAYIQALSTDQHAEHVRSQLGKLYLSQGKSEKAEALYNELLHQYDKPSYHANLGLACYQQGKFNDACLAYERALSGDPANGERQFALGHALYAAGKFQEASAWLEKASVQLSRNTDLLQMLAECYVKLHDFPQAKSTYKKLNRLQPYNEEIKAKMMSLAVA